MFLNEAEKFVDSAEDFLYVYRTHANIQIIESLLRSIKTTDEAEYKFRLRGLVEQHLALAESEVR